MMRLLSEKPTILIYETYRDDFKNQPNTTLEIGMY